MPLRRVDRHSARLIVLTAPRRKLDPPPPRPPEGDRAGAAYRPPQPGAVFPEAVHPSWVGAPALQGDCTPRNAGPRILRPALASDAARGIDDPCPDKGAPHTPPHRTNPARPRGRSARYGTKGFGPRHCYVRNRLVGEETMTTTKVLIPLIIFFFLLVCVACDPSSSLKRFPEETKPLDAGQLAQRPLLLYPGATAVTVVRQTRNFGPDEPRPERARYTWRRTELQIGGHARRLPSPTSQRSGGLVG